MRLLFLTVELTEKFLPSPSVTAKSHFIETRQTEKLCGDAASTISYLIFHTLQLERVKIMIIIIKERSKSSNQTHFAYMWKPTGPYRATSGWQFGQCLEKFPFKDMYIYNVWLHRPHFVTLWSFIWFEQKYCLYVNELSASNINW